MGYVPRRSDCTESTAFRRMPMNDAFIRAEKIYDFLFPEKLGLNGKKIRTRPKGADYFLDE